jgi:internalin A
MKSVIDVFAVLAVAVLALMPGMLQAQTQSAGDFDNNGKVEFADFLLFAQAFGGNHAQYDLDESGKVDFPDFVRFATAFNQSPFYILTFADGALEAAVREAIGKSIGPIEIDDVEDLTELEFVSSRLASLDGLQRLTSLESLVIRDARRTMEPGPAPAVDLTPLSRLTGLRRLQLAGFTVNDFSPLAALSSLEGLVLSSIASEGTLEEGQVVTAEAIDDVSFIGGLTELRALTLWTTGGRHLRLGAEDLAAVAALPKLESLAVVGCYLPEGGLGILAGSENLRELSVTFEDFSPVDLSPLASFPSLEHLAIGGIGLADLSPLAHLASLKKLYLGENRFGLWPSENFDSSTRLSTSITNTQVSDLSPVEGLVGLEELVIGWTEVRDFTPLASLTGLTRLSLGGESGNLIEDISALANLTGLEHLDLGWHPITSLAPLENLTNLRTLSFNSRSPALTDLSPLSNLTGMTELKAYCYHVSDISALKDLTSLRLLTLRYSAASDLTPLSGLFALETLDLGTNGFRDLAPLSSLSALQSVELRGNPLSEEAVATQIPALQARGVEVTYISR